MQYYVKYYAICKKSGLEIAVSAIRVACSLILNTTKREGRK